MLRHSSELLPPHYSQSRPEPRVTQGAERQLLSDYHSFHLINISYNLLFKEIKINTEKEIGLSKALGGLGYSLCLSNRKKPANIINLGLKSLYRCQTVAYKMLLCTFLNNIH